MGQDTSPKKDILRTIRRHRRSGVPLNYSAIRQTNGPLLVKACQSFGSWRAAIKAAGLDYEKISRIHR